MCKCSSKTLQPLSCIACKGPVTGRMTVSDAHSNDYMIMTKCLLRRRDVDLSINKITCLKAVYNCYNLHTLNLNDNCIAEIGMGLPNSLQSLSLAGNSLTTVHGE